MVIFRSIFDISLKTVVKMGVLGRYWVAKWGHLGGIGWQNGGKMGTKWGWKNYPKTLPNPQGGLHPRAALEVHLDQTPWGVWVQFGTLKMTKR